MKKLDPRSVLIGFLVAVIGFMSLGASNTTFDSITVGEIIMKDERLDIKDKRQRPLLTIAGSEFIHALLMHNVKGDQIFHFSENDYGDGIININNSAGQSRIKLYADSETKDGVIKLYNTTGQATMILANDQNNGAIGLYNSAGQKTMILANDPDGGVIGLYNSEGRETIRLGHSGDRTPIVSLYNKHKKRVVYIGTTEEDDGHIILYDRYGEGQWGVTGKRP